MGGSLVELPLAKIPSRASTAREFSRIRELATSPQKVSRAHPLSPATKANRNRTIVSHVERNLFTRLTFYEVVIYAFALTQKCRIVDFDIRRAQLG